MVVGKKTLEFNLAVGEHSGCFRIYVINTLIESHKRIGFFNSIITGG